MIFYEALLRKNIPTEMHLFAHGTHGFALALDDQQLSRWKDLLLGWLSNL